MDLGLKGLNAILVGANGGIGREVALALTAEGCNVAVCGRSQAKVDKISAELAGRGVTVIAETLNVTDVEAVPAFVESSAKALGGCDIFISFTSINLGQDSDAGWQALLDSDILPMRRGIAAARPFLKESKNASVLCISSTGAVEEFMGVQPYNAMKAATMAYSAALSQAMAPEGIRVNCLTPGPIWTDDGPWANIQANMPDFFSATVAKIPLGSMTKGSDLAKTIAFMVSPASMGMVGANVVVDGGYTKRNQF